MAVNAYGLRIGIRSNEENVWKQLIPCLPPEWKPARTLAVERLYSLRALAKNQHQRSGRYVLLVGSRTLARSADLAQALEAFETDVTQYVAEYARRRLFVHAGVVEWGGRAIVIPGRSFSGKSTLVAELVRLGATYYSDEYAVLDGEGRVHPYPRPLSIRGDGRKPAKVPVEELGGLPGDGPAPVGVVAVAPYRAGVRWRPRTLTAGQGVLELLANTVSARHQPAMALATLHKVFSEATVLKGTRGEAGATASALLDFMDSHFVK